jgi:hypothetical protein
MRLWPLMFSLCALACTANASAEDAASANAYDPAKADRVHDAISAHWICLFDKLQGKLKFDARDPLVISALKSCEPAWNKFIEVDRANARPVDRESVEKLARIARDDLQMRFNYTLFVSFLDPPKHDAGGHPAASTAGSK